MIDNRSGVIIIENGAAKCPIIFERKTSVNPNKIINIFFGNNFKWLFGNVIYGCWQSL